MTEIVAEQTAYWRRNTGTTGNKLHCGSKTSHLWLTIILTHMIWLW